MHPWESDMYQHILVAVVFDPDHARERSLQTAKILSSPGGKVTVLHVKESIPSYAI